jgi:hypothetical protein
MSFASKHEAAVHEAAHAVIAYRLHLPLIGAEIFPSEVPGEGWNGSCHVEEIVRPERPRAWALYSVAGIAAEALFLHAGRDDPAAHRAALDARRSEANNGDIAEFEACVKAAARQRKRRPATIAEAYLRAAWKLVAQNRVPILAVAAHLERHDRLDADTVAAIILYGRPIRLT